MAAKNNNTGLTVGRGRERGFTLIELSIVLVIIGLIVGGVLAGQSLIAAAAVRAQISQIERYNTAAATFQGKYGYLPGDIPAGPAAQFGFQARGQYAGQGDGNGIIDGSDANGIGTQYGTITNGGETALFWNDLATARLIDYGYSSYITYYTLWTTVTAATVPNISNFFPSAKIGNGNYVYVWSGGPLCCHSNDSSSNGRNYFGISSVTSVNSGQMTSTPGMAVLQASSIDTKLDDGLPQSGRVTAMYLTNNGGQYVTWAGTSTTQSAPWTAATPGSSATCFDNGNTAGIQQTYSVGQNNGAGINCALSFQMQAGD
jgi:prepilin-type N-terminal cleavage/methylation domain-containing protein